MSTDKPTSLEGAVFPAHRFVRLIHCTLSLILVTPVLLVLLSALWNNGPSVDNLRAVYDDVGYSLRVLRNTTCLAAATTVFCMAIAIPLGHLLFRTNLIGRSAYICGFCLAAAIPLYITSAAWIAMVGNDFWLGAKPWWQNVLLASLVQSVAWLPLSTLLCGLAFASVDADLEDQATLDATKAQTFLKATLPQAAWGLAGAAVCIAVLSLSDITVVDTLVLQTLQREVYTQFQLPAGKFLNSTAYLHPRRAAAVALPAVILCAAGLFALHHRLLSHGEGTERGAERRPKQIQLGSCRWPVSILVFAIVAAVLGFPFISLLRRIHGVVDLTNAWGSTQRELGNTIILAIVAATLCTIVACVWARYIQHRTGGLFIALAAILMATPAPLVGIGLIVSTNNDLLGFLYGTRALYVYAWVLRALPFAVLVLHASFRRIPQALEDECRLEGLGVLHRLKHVILPLNWRAFLGAWLLCFILHIGELGASFLVAAPGYPTITIRFFTLIHLGVDSGVAGICLIVMGAVLLPATMACVLLWHHLMKRFV